MSKAKDLTGQRFGRLVALEPTEERKSNHVVWKCQCDCGNLCLVQSNSLLCGYTQSCGCLQKEIVSKDLTGERFGMLVALEAVSERKNGVIMWKCQCDCGNLCFIRTSSLKLNRVQSCGCLRKENASKHNMSKKRLYGVWNAMNRRCYSTQHKSYKDYGGRGITVCDEWRNDFQAFHDWAMANGYDENAPRGACTLDRIDVDGNYEPSNCRWVDMKTQANNKRKNKTVPN